MLDMPLRILASGHATDDPGGVPVWAHVVCAKGPMLPVAYPLTIGGREYLGIVARELDRDEQASYQVDATYEVVVELRLEPEA